MQITDTNPGERKKLIWALALGLVAILFLWWTFFGFGGSSKPRGNRNPQTNVTPGNRTAVNPAPIQRGDELKTLPLEQLRPVSYSPTLPSVAEARRNIFVYYEKPPAPVASAPIPTPTPPPPVLLAAVSPSNVYARTDDFTVEVTGDRFTPEVRITVDGRELPTRFVSPQQLSATVPAAMIANPGARPVIVRSPDGKLYSNETMLNVSPPPTPNYTYIGIIGTKRRQDTAILQDKGSREILNVQRGDVLGGRFRLTSISEEELVLVDTTLKVKHTLAMTMDQNKGFSPQTRPTPKADSEDDEP
ncbi:MAG: IPT/TIG domain-containing protein [Pyrinomonadaceae bacterium]